MLPGSEHGFFCEEYLLNCVIKLELVHVIWPGLTNNMAGLAGEQDRMMQGRADRSMGQKRDVAASNVTGRGMRLVPAEIVDQEGERFAQFAMRHAEPVFRVQLAWLYERCANFNVGFFDGQLCTPHITFGANNVQAWVSAGPRCARGRRTRGVVYDAIGVNSQRPKGAAMETVKQQPQMSWRVGSVSVSVFRHRRTRGDGSEFGDLFWRGDDKVTATLYSSREDFVMKQARALLGLTFLGRRTRRCI